MRHWLVAGDKATPGACFQGPFIDRVVLRCPVLMCLLLEPHPVDRPDQGVPRREVVMNPGTGRHKPAREHQWQDRHIVRDDVCRLNHQLPTSLRIEFLPLQIVQPIIFRVAVLHLVISRGTTLASQKAGGQVGQTGPGCCTSIGRRELRLDQRRAVRGFEGAACPEATSVEITSESWCRLPAGPQGRRHSAGAPAAETVRTELR